jgi:hypothetical protein
MGMEAAELRDGGRLKDIRAFIESLYGYDLHAKRVDSLAAATLGVMTGASLAVAMIGQALAQARDLVTKRAIQPVDRLLSNSAIDVWERRCVRPVRRCRTARGRSRIRAKSGH